MNEKSLQIGEEFVPSERVDIDENLLDEELRFMAPKMMKLLREIQDHNEEITDKLEDRRFFIHHFKEEFGPKPGPQFIGKEDFNWMRMTNDWNVEDSV